MLGWIMPEPLAMAPMVTVSRPRGHQGLLLHRVGGHDGVGRGVGPVPGQPPPPRARPARMAAMLRVWPMTPVEATTKSVGLSPVAGRPAAHISSAFSWPLGAQALALPELAIARARRPQVVHGHIEGRGLHPVLIRGRRRTGTMSARSFSSPAPPASCSLEG